MEARVAMLNSGVFPDAYNVLDEDADPIENSGLVYYTKGVDGEVDYDNEMYAPRGTWRMVYESHHKRG